MREMLRGIYPALIEFKGTETPLIAPYADCICGHLSFQQIQNLYNYKIITLLRDPVNCEVSYINWVARTERDGMLSVRNKRLLSIARRNLDHYIECAVHDNVMLNIFQSDESLQSAKDTLAALDLVGFTESLGVFEDKLSVLLRATCFLPEVNVTGIKEFNFTAAQREQIAARKTNDLALYHYARTL